MQNYTQKAAELVEKFSHQESMPEYWAQDALHWFLPLLDTIIPARSAGRAPCIGINGAQGTGKSTLAKLLVMLLREQQQLNAVTLSLDDFYYSRQQRQQLAASIHPLLATRGVPGTHDIELALDTLQRLREGESIPLPRFNKATDDSVPREQWQLNVAPTDVIILEGWCLGVPAQPAAELHEPVNQLESREDPHGIWRRYVNDNLGGPYQTLFRQIDQLIMLQAPDFECVFKWRLLQEDKLRASLPANGQLRLMNEAQIRRFIAHYERLTRHALAVLPQRADVVLRLDQQHRIVAQERRHG